LAIAGHAEAERRGERRVAGERPTPAHREDVEAIVRMAEDLGLVSAE
jgi:hypothetical protein